MNLQINKDFERAYREDMWKGFSAKQTLCLVIAFFASALVTAGLYFGLRLPVQLCIYATIPIVTLIVGMGFWRYQEMSLLEFYRAVHHQNKTRLLFWQAGEGEV